MAKTLDYANLPAPPPPWDRRGLLIGAGAGEVVLAVLAYAGASAPVVIYQLLLDGAFVLACLLGAAGWGACILARQARNDGDGGDGVLRFTTATALGLGLISLATLSLGLAGWLNRGTAAGLVVGGLVAGGVLAWRRWGDMLQGDLGARLRPWLAGRAGWNWLWLVALPLLAVALVAACVPPGFLWNPDEPHGYDVVSYHFQVPREWFEAGRIVPLKHNVFSYFPFGVEMHYLLAMHLRGGPWKGMYLAQHMHAAHVVLTVAAVYGLAFSLTRRQCTAVAGGLVASAVPWMTLLAPIGYNEGGLLLYGTLAIGWALRAIDAPPRIALARFAVAGAMAGFACGAKLTAVPMLLAAVPVAAVVVWPRTWKYAVAYGVVGAALFAPWAVRNVAWTGNPVFPEAARLMGRGHFTEVQVERWERAHSARPDQRALSARLSALGVQVVGDWRFGYVPLALGVVAAGVGFRDRRVRALALLGVIFLLFWLSLTHLQGRFLVLAVPVVALLVALAEWRKLSPALPPVAALTTLVAVALVHGEFYTRLHGPSPLTGTLGADDLSGLNPPEVAQVPDDATLVLVGEARAFWYPRPMSRLRYRTVFDVDTSGGSDVVQAWRGESGPGDWLLVNPSELQRFANTYWGIPQPPAELKGGVESVLVRPGEVR
jgi:hypothetical protein